MQRILPILFLVLSLATEIHGQSAPANTPQRPTYLDDDTYFASLFAGAGISSDGTVRPVSVQFGGSAGMATLGRNPGDLGMMQFIETGAIGPLADRHAPAAFLSYDFGTNILPSRDSHTVPFAVAGYSYLFSQASAINFGAGVDFYFREYRAIRVEVRDYFTFTQTPQHNVAFRIGWVLSANDP